MPGALKDHKRAIILEKVLTEKDQYSQLFLLKMEGIRLTISKYYLPSGKSISEVGVSPDIVVKEESEFKMDSDSDNQLNYAIKLFQS